VSLRTRSYQFQYYLHDSVVKELIERYYGSGVWRNVAWDGIGVDLVFNFFTPSAFVEFLRLFREIKERYGFSYRGVIDCDDFSALAKAVASLLGFNCMFEAGGEIVDERGELVGYHAYNVVLYCISEDPAECMDYYQSRIVPILFEPQTDEVAVPTWPEHFYIYGIGWVRYSTRVVKPW